MKLRYWTYNLPFKHPFTISKGTKTHQPTFIVELEHFGLKGYGEAPAISYYHISLEKMIGDLEEKKTILEKFAFTEPARYWHFLHHLIPHNDFLVCALDMAAWDLYGKLRNQPLYKLWGTDFSKTVMTDYTIGIDSIDIMIEKLKEKPWPIYKIKLGTTNDIDIIKSLRAHTKAVLRVDANAAWTLAEALEKMPVLQQAGVEFVEQPLAKDNWKDMEVLYQQSPIPLLADESCVTENDVDKCFNKFHGINIKLTKCGGITPALRMIAGARKLNMRVMMGSMNECTIGSAAIAQFLPQLDYVDMDGPLLLDEDPATGLEFDDGCVIITDRPGLGVEFLEGSDFINPRP